MKSRNDFLLTVWVLSSLILGSFGANGQTAKRLSVPDAERLVAAWVRTHLSKDTAWHPHPRLKDMTTKEIGERLGAQVFKLRDFTDSEGEVDAYLIKDRMVYPLSIGIGGWGLTSLCVCNLDSRLGLAYTYSWGSGIHRSHLAILLMDQSSPVKVETNFVIRYADLLLKKQDDQTVLVYALASPRNILLGRLRLTGKATHVRLDMQFEPGLPNEWRNRVWRN